MAEIEPVNKENFHEKVVTSALPVLVDFWTPTCIPCKGLSHVLEKFNQTVDGKLKIIKINAEECSELARQWGVRGVPTLILFHQGKVVGTRTGFLLPHELTQWLDSCLTGE